MPNDDYIVELTAIKTFLRCHATGMIAGALLGMGGAFALWKNVPPRYEARMEIQLASIVSDTSGLQPGKQLIEEPSVLLARLKRPGGIVGSEIYQDCGIPSRDPQKLAQAIQASPDKDIPTVIDVVVSGSSPDRARTCAQSVFETISTLQSMQKDALLETGRSKLQQLQVRLNSVTSALRHTQGSMAMVIVNANQMMRLAEHIDMLENGIASSERYPTQMLGPIESPSTPVSPVLSAYMQFGLLLGGIGGLLASMWIRSRRSGSGKQAASPAGNA